MSKSATKVRYFLVICKFLCVFLVNKNVADTINVIHYAFLIIRHCFPHRVAVRGLGKPAIGTLRGSKNGLDMVWIWFAYGRTMVGFA